MTAGRGFSVLSGMDWGLPQLSLNLKHFLLYRFSINALNQLCVHDLDYELEQVVYITVLAKDNGGVAPYNEGNALFTINVINDNDNSPYFVPYTAAVVLVEKVLYTNFLTLQVSAYIFEFSPSFKSQLTHFS